MHLIACSERLIVVCQCSFSWISLSLLNQIVERNVSTSSMMFMLSPIFIRWSAHWAPKHMVPQSVLVVCIFLTFILMQLWDNICHSHVSKGNPKMKIIKCPSSAALLINCCWSSLNHWLSLNNIAPSNDLNACSSVYTQQVFFSLSLSDAKHNFDGLWRLIIWFFFALSWSEYCLFSFSGSTVLPPGGQLFKEFREVLMSFLSGILQIQSMFFLFDNLPCSGIKSHISTLMSIQI